MTPSRKQEYTRRITQANKTQLITILYDMILDYLAEALTGQGQTDKDAFDSLIGAADACIDELITSLDLNYELARNLYGLYLFEKKELLHSRIRGERSGLEHAASVFTALRDAYRVLEKEDTTAPVMVNVETVYAGMTYGRGSLTENVSSDYTNRGFKA